MSRYALAASCLIFFAANGVRNAGAAREEQPAVERRIATRPFLNMPDTSAGAIPMLLSRTGAFQNTKSLTPTEGLLPYDLVLPFWSDGAQKSRLVAIPQGKVIFSLDHEWTFPRGTVFVKTFTLPVDATHPEVSRRLETRLLILDRNGGAYGVVYKWRSDLSDADLVGQAGASENIIVRDASGQHLQKWTYPGRDDCVACHNANTAGQLGPKTRQLNVAFKFPDGVTENQLRRWNRLDLFTPRLSDRDYETFAALARPGDPSRSLEDRARSWLDVNCAQCHRPGGTVAGFDARYETPLERQYLVDGPVLINQGIDRARVVSPHDPWRSMVIRRTDTNDDTRMPPIARNTIDQQGVAVVRQWVGQLPGRDVLAPPAMLPKGGDFHAAVDVSLSSGVPGAQIRYTLDGSSPEPSDPLYAKPIHIDGPTVVRARAFKDGLTRSVVVQQTYLVEH